MLRVADRAATEREREYWRLWLRAMAATVTARLGLIVFPLGRVRRMVRWICGSARPLRVAPRPPAEALIRASVSAGLHSPVGTTCLAGALVAKALLDRHGYESKMRLGVRRGADGQFAAHAWVERDHKVVVGGTASEIACYTPVPEMEHLIR